MTVRVLHVPAEHPYVARLVDPDGAGDVVVLPAPVEQTARWGPPVALDPGWVRSHAQDLDVLHVHFGFDAVPPARLAATVEALRAAGVGLVLTVHDLVNPHHVHPGPHAAALDVLVPAADAVLTLTPVAAAEIAARWGVDVEVVPHPQVSDDRWLATPRTPHAGTVVRLPLKALRANVAAGPLLDALLPAVRERPDVSLVVGLHREVVEPGFPRADPALVTRLRSLHDAGRLTLDLHDRPDDDEVAATLLATDLLVLPYTHGTHSGWVELCHDLGTAVLAPADGAWVQQQPCLTYRWLDGTPDAREVAAAVDTVRRGHPAPRAQPAARREQGRRGAATHAEVYRRVTRAARAAA